MRIAYLVIVLTFVYSEAALHVSVNQTSGGLTLACVFDDAQAHLIDLELARNSTGHNDVIASISIFDPNTPTVTESGVFVDYNISPGSGGHRHLAVRWSQMSGALVGTYTCRATLLDASDQTITQLESVDVTTLAGGVVNLQAAPEIVEIGLTDEFTLSCITNTRGSDELASVGVISLYEIRDSSPFEIWLSTVTTGAGLSLKPGIEDVELSGSVGSLNTDAFLLMRWRYPRSRLAGLFVCEVQGVGKNGTLATLKQSIRVNVKNVSADRLANRIKELANKIEKNNVILSHAERIISNFKNISKEHNRTITELKNALPSCNSSSFINPCDGLMNANPGHHIIKSDFAGSLSNVMCFVDNNGKPWTAFQNRFNGSLSFNKTFAEYEQGFGDVHGEFWMGLRYVRQFLVSKNSPSSLRIDMRDEFGVKSTRVYPVFDLGAAPDYVLTVSGYDDNGNGLSYHSGHAFATPDKPDPEGCAESSGSGWWFSKCYVADLNGPYESTGPTWFDFHIPNPGLKLTHTRMMFS